MSDDQEDSIALPIGGGAQFVVKFAPRQQFVTIKVGVGTNPLATIYVRAWRDGRMISMQSLHNCGSKREQKST